MERRTLQKRFEDDINVANIIMRHSSKKSIQEPFKNPYSTALFYVVVAGASITIMTVGKKWEKMLHSRVLKMDILSDFRN